MEERELVKKMTEYLQQQPRGKKIPYSQIAKEIDAPYSTEHLKRIVRRSDSPYYRAVFGGVKTIGKGDKKTQSSRATALLQRRGFLRKIFEKDPQSTLRPELRFTKAGDMTLGNHDVLQDGRLSGSTSDTKASTVRPDIDLQI